MPTPASDRVFYTKLDERGRLFSGGERQRLSIVRTPEKIRY
jgi:ABC-type multidrug transport system fused ATPase/permease subunit